MSPASFCRFVIAQGFHELENAFLYVVFAKRRIELENLADLIRNFLLIEA